MSELIEGLNSILDIKNNLKSSIETKGGEVSNFSSFAAAVNNIEAAVVKEDTVAYVFQYYNREDFLTLEESSEDGKPSIITETRYNWIENDADDIPTTRYEYTSIVSYSIGSDVPECSFKYEKQTYEGNEVLEQSQFDTEEAMLAALSGDGIALDGIGAELIKATAEAAATYNITEYRTVYVNKNTYTYNYVGGSTGGEDDGCWDLPIYNTTESQISEEEYSANWDGAVERWNGEVSPGGPGDEESGHWVAIMNPYGEQVEEAWSFIN